MGKFTIHFFSFTYNFTQVKVKEIGLSHRVKIIFQKKLSFPLKNAIVKLALL